MLGMSKKPFSSLLVMTAAERLFRLRFLITSEVCAMRGTNEANHAN